MSNLDDVRHALTGLKIRLAGGEITREEFQSIREELLAGLMPADRAALSPESPTPVPGRVGPSAGETRFQDRRLDAIVEGTVVGGRYRVQALIGRGGMAAVYRVADLELDGAVRALKVLSPTAAGTAGTSDAGSLVARFKQEVQLGQERLRHDNIIAIYGYGRDGDGPEALHYAVMELVEGWDLKTVVEERRRGGHDPALTPVEISSILRQLAEALAFAHGRGVIHRDIKPSNVLMTWRNDQWHVKLGDFGIARVVEGPALTTTTGAGPMTLDYSAPEQRGSVAYEVGPWSDVYQYGLVAYELFQAFSGRRWDPSSPSNHFPSWVPLSVAAVIQSCLRFNPEERSQDVAAVLSALQNAGSSAHQGHLDDRQAGNTGTEVETPRQEESPTFAPRESKQTATVEKRPSNKVLRMMAVVGVMVVLFFGAQTILPLMRGQSDNHEPQMASVANAVDSEELTKLQGEADIPTTPSGDAIQRPTPVESVSPDLDPTPQIVEKPLLVVKALGGATVEVDGTYVDSGEELTFPVSPGYHSVKASRNGRVVLNRQVLVGERGATIEVPELAALSESASAGTSPILGQSANKVPRDNDESADTGFTFITGGGKSSTSKTHSLGRKSDSDRTAGSSYPPQRYAIFLNFMRAPSRTCTSKIVRTLEAAFSTKGIQALDDPTGREVDALRSMLGRRTVTLYDSDFAHAMRSAGAAYVATMHVNTMGEIEIRCYLQGRHTGNIQLSNACNFYKGWSGRFYKDAGDFGREIKID